MMRAGERRLAGSPYNAGVTASGARSRRPGASAPRAGRRGGSGPRARRADSGWTVGVDAGGTWIRVLAQRATGRARALTVRAASGDLDEILAGAWRRLALAAPEIRGLVIASRGIWTPRERAAAARRRAGLAQRVRVISDVEAAHLGALGTAPGVLLLAGTGSIALGRDARGRWARAGGLGPLLGDAGSAFAIGRDWLATEAARGKAARARALAVGPEPVARIAALAPAVLARARRGDRGARGAVATAQAALAALAIDVTRGLRLARPVLVSWAGGLLADPRFRAGVWRALRRAGLAIAPVAPRADALGAAAALARSLAGRAPADASRRPRRRSRTARARPSTGTRRSR